MEHALFVNFVPKPDPNPNHISVCMHL